MTAVCVKKFRKIAKFSKNLTDQCCYKLYLLFYKNTYSSTLRITIPYSMTITNQVCCTYGCDLNQ